MPELPEIELYLHALRPRVLGQPLERVRLASVSLLRTVDPPVSTVYGKRVTGLRRLGKRIIFELEDDLFVVVHLMIAGRLQWKAAGAPLARKLAHAAFDFPNGTLLLTEAGTNKRASMHVVRGDRAVQTLHRGGIEPLTATFEELAAALTRENRTVKRALTDPRILSGGWQRAFR